jgi:N-acyl-phosphatidylethanolamine-hydrolysing phospholipase D
VAASSAMRRRSLAAGSRHRPAMPVVPLALAALLAAAPALAQAPRDGARFANLAGPGERGSFLGVHLPFLARRVWESFRTPVGAAPRVPWDPEALTHNPGITWIGHATLLVRLDGVTFLTDPTFSERASPVSFAGPRRAVAPGVPLDALPPVDFAVISHDHYDHTDLPTIRALAARGVRFVVPLGLGELVRGAGGEAVELDWWQSTAFGPVTIHCVPAQHFSGRGLTGGDRRLWAGFVVAGPSQRFYHAGDTGYFDGFAEIGARLGPIDLAALPIGAYEPLAMMRFVHLTPEDAVQAALDLGARRAVGMHFGTFVLTDEPLDEPPRRFLAEADRRGLGAARAWVLAVGETRTW